MRIRASLPFLGAAVLGSTTMFVGSAAAQAFYLQEQSARGAGRAFSGEAADTGPDSLWWNPAASAAVDRPEATVSVAAILPRGEVIDRGTVIVRPGQPPVPVGGSAYSFNPIREGVLPAGAIAVPLGGRLAVGLTLASPYSFTTDYAPESWARYSADRTELRTYDIQPSLAFAPMPWLRIGGALNVERVEATLSNALPNLDAALPDGRQVLRGDGWDLGWTAGAQVDLGPVTIGGSYKSGIRHQLKGDLTVSGLLGPLAAQNTTLSGVRASFRTPWQAIGSIRARVTDRLTLNGQVVRYGWSDFDAIRLGAPLDTAIPEGYRDSWSYAGGVDYVATRGLTLRAGAQHATTPTRTGARDARVPDADRWNYGVGASIGVKRGFSLDVAANYVTFDDVPIDRPTAAFAGSAAQTPIVTRGALRDANAVVLSIGGRMRF